MQPAPLAERHECLWHGMSYFTAGGFPALGKAVSAALRGHSGRTSPGQGNSTGAFVAQSYSDAAKPSEKDSRQSESQTCGPTLSNTVDEVELANVLIPPWVRTCQNSCTSTSISQTGRQHRRKEEACDTHHQVRHTQERVPALLHRG